MDQAFDRPVAPFSGDGLLIEKCLDAPACLAAYARALADVAGTAAAMDLGGEIDGAIALIADAAREDPRKPFEDEKYLRHQAEVRALAAAWPAAFAAAAGCVDGGAEADRDGDGYGACAIDCDDGDASAHPGAGEVCDGADDDCDRMVDELASCACEELEVAGAEFLLCPHAVTYATARSLCEARQATLARIDGGPVNAAVFAAGQQLAPGRWYIGYTDRDTEGIWRWEDGEDGGYEAFAAGDPDDFGEEDCAVLDPFANGDWTTCAATARCPTCAGGSREGATRSGAPSRSGGDGPAPERSEGDGAVRGRREAALPRGAVGMGRLPSGARGTGR
jgi:hypothetical protein